MIKPDPDCPDCLGTGYREVNYIDRHGVSRDEEVVCWCVEMAKAEARARRAS